MTVNATHAAEACLSFVAAPPEAGSSSSPTGAVTQARLESEGRFLAEMPRLSQRTVTRATTITQVATTVSLHPWLPPTPVWAYDGQVPGPMLETRSGRPVSVRFRNRIDKAMPFRSVRGADGAQATCGTVPDDQIVDLSGLSNATVTHLHGGATEAASDGWPEDMMLPGQDQVHAYANAGSALFWYHDHAAMSTRLSVFAGLAAPYVVRDHIDAHLPAGDRELVMVLADRNLDTDAAGNLTGAVLHKTADKEIPGQAGGPMEFFGPITLVNGAIWPRCTVSAAQHRVRLLNGSNARTYRLTLVDAEGRRRAGRITQIGTDGGLLPLDPAASPAERAAQGPWRFADDETLTLAPGERIDLIIDFRGATGPLRFVNEAEAPYGGNTAAVDLVTGLAADAAMRAHVADVVRFDIVDATECSCQVDQDGHHIGTCPADRFDLDALVNGPLWPTYTRYDHDQPGMHDHTHRLIALVENPDTGVLTSNELWKPGDPTTRDALGDQADYLLRAPYLTLVAAPSDPTAPLPSPVTWATAASAFRDAATFYAILDRYELWKVYNLTGDTHPFHIHLSPFQVLARTELTWVPSPAHPQGEWAPADNIDPTGADNQVVTLGAGRPLERGDAGWNDTVRVNPGEMLTLMVRFTGHLGRYLYHCHILEHEDHDMMRPFVVVPHAGMGGAHHGAAAARPGPAVTL